MTPISYTFGTGADALTINVYPSSVIEFVRGQAPYASTQKATIQHYTLDELAKLLQVNA